MQMTMRYRDVSWLYNRASCDVYGRGHVIQLLKIIEILPRGGASNTVGYDYGARRQSSRSRERYDRSRSSSRSAAPYHGGSGSRGPPWATGGSSDRWEAGRWR